jgi:uncharacterized protein
MRAGPYRGIAWWCCCVLLAIGSAWGAKSAEVPEATSLLVDEAGALSEEEHDALLRRLTSIQNSQRAQIGVLISKSTAGAPLSDYALRVAESWKLGRSRRDDGLLILIVPAPAGARIEVGYGLEGAIPDAKASRWLDDLLPAIREKQIAKGLDQLLDRIDAALPAAQAKPEKKNFLDAHEEWKLPFVLLVFSPFAIFPMFVGRWGSIPAAFLLATFLGIAAGALWDTRTAGYIAAAIAFPMPLLWGLNHTRTGTLGPWLRGAKHFGNFVAVTFFFAVISVFVCGGLSVAEQQWWPGLFFSGLLAIALAVFLFPGKPAEYLMVMLRSAIHFVFLLTLAYVSLQPFTPDPTRLAFLTAGLLTAVIAAGLYLDSLERDGFRVKGVRLSMVFYSLAVLLALPFALLALFLAAGGEDAQTQLVQLAAGGGSIAAIVGLAVRVGLIAAVRVGLGGMFGGGGAGRSD